MHSIALSCGRARPAVKAWPSLFPKVVETMSFPTSTSQDCPIAPALAHSLLRGPDAATSSSKLSTSVGSFDSCQAHTQASSVSKARWQRRKKMDGQTEANWVASAYHQALSKEPDVDVAYGNVERFVAFGELVVSEKYIMRQAIPCSSVGRPAPTCLKLGFDFPHVTVAKLDNPSKILNFAIFMFALAVFEILPNGFVYSAISYFAT